MSDEAEGKMIIESNPFTRQIRIRFTEGEHTREVVLTLRQATDIAQAMLDAVRGMDAKVAAN